MLFNRWFMGIPVSQDFEQLLSHLLRKSLQVKRSEQLLQVHLRSKLHLLFVDPEPFAKFVGRTAPGSAGVSPAP